MVNYEFWENLKCFSYNPVADIMANELSDFNKIFSVVMSSCVVVAVGVCRNWYVCISARLWVLQSTQWSQRATLGSWFSLFIFSRQGLSCLHHLSIGSPGLQMCALLPVFLFLKTDYLVMWQVFLSVEPSAIR